MSGAQVRDAVAAAVHPRPTVVGLNEDLVSKDEVLVKASLARDEPTGGQLTSKPKSCPCQAAPALDCRKSAEP
jgi:hypothetical protein